MCCCRLPEARHHPSFFMERGTRISGRFVLQWPALAKTHTVFIFMCQRKPVCKQHRPLHERGVGRWAQHVENVWGGGEGRSLFPSTGGFKTCWLGWWAHGCPSHGGASPKSMQITNVHITHAHGPTHPSPLPPTQAETGARNTARGCPGGGTFFLGGGAAGRLTQPWQPA